MSRECTKRTAKVFDKRDGRRACVAGGRDNAVRRVAASPTSPRVAPLLHEKERLEGHISALAKEICWNKELKAKIAELEAARKTKTKATTAAPRKEDMSEVWQCASCRRIRLVTAATADTRDRAALKREQLASDVMKASYDRLENSARFQDSSLAVPPDSDQREVTEATVIIEMLVQSHHSNQRRGLQHPAAFESEDDDDGSPRQTGATPGGYLGRTALRREQYDVLQ
jgi:hypothetical protein